MPKGKSRQEQQATKQVQLLAIRANVSTANEQQQQQQQQQQQEQQQWPIPDTADGNKQRLSKLTGIFKYKGAASKQVVCCMQCYQTMLYRSSKCLGLHCK